MPFPAEAFAPCVDGMTSVMKDVVPASTKKQALPQVTASMQAQLS
jgi:hypothetical protein